MRPQFRVASSGCEMAAGCFSSSNSLNPAVLVWKKNGYPLASTAMRDFAIQEEDFPGGITFSIPQGSCLTQGGNHRRHWNAGWEKTRKFVPLRGLHLPFPIWQSNSCLS
jgi:hypothetical protein